MVLRSLLRSKIHRAVVTQANLDYIGSLTVDSSLLEAAGLREFELVHVANIETGARLETYLISGAAGSGIIGANGAAAQLLHIGDHIIIMAYAQVEEPLPEKWSPKILLLTEENKITEIINP
jgi:aspartate 1-decarboxylase